MSTVDPASTNGTHTRPKNVWDWRRDPVRRATLQLFPGRQVRELARLIERKPGFRDDLVQREFASGIRAWAHLWLEEDRRPAPEPKYTRGAKTRLTRVEKAADALTSAVGKLRKPEREELFAQVAGAMRGRHPALAPPADLTRYAPDRRWFVEMLEAHRQNDERAWRVRTAMDELAEFLAEGARRAASVAIAPKGRSNVLGRAVLHLADDWTYYTGRPPTVTVHTHREKIEGAFPEFARSAVHVLWPDAGELNGLLRDVCTRSKPKRR